MILIPFGIIAVTFLAVALSFQSEVTSDEGMMGAVSDFMPLGALGWSIVWCTVSLIVLHVRGSYQPGINMGMDFMAWATALVMGGFTFWWALAFDYTELNCGYETREQCRIAKALDWLELLGALFTLLIGYVAVALDPAVEFLANRV
ncbi:hypothetical protein LTR37_017714 [Vermiconidia calcicola]|uniref:Uncharacterized protein n=1 Tax=Vermiconidia calcicola TaxID=1690605 RepID=A0ACC3MKS3_9PEZI|nr:hypothetical protein LTR37_017714 [Vermiconidia calcicola]